MSYPVWKNKTNSFKKIDVRGIQGTRIDEEKHGKIEM